MRRNVKGTQLLAGVLYSRKELGPLVELLEPLAAAGDGRIHEKATQALGIAVKNP